MCVIGSSSRSDLSEDASGTSPPFISIPGSHPEPIESGRINLIGQPHHRGANTTVVSSLDTPSGAILQQMTDKQHPTCPTEQQPNGPIVGGGESVTFESDYNKNDKLIRDHVDITPRRYVSPSDFTNNSIFDLERS